MVVNAEGREPSGTVTRRRVRVAVSWLRVLARDLSPAAVPAPPLAARSARGTSSTSSMRVSFLGPKARCPVVHEEGASDRP